MTLRFRDMYALTHHRTTPTHEYTYNRMHPSSQPEVPDPSQDALTATLHHATPDTPSHAGYDAQRGRYRGSLKVFALARTVLWYRGDRDVEAGKAGKPAEDEKGEQ